MRTGLEWNEDYENNGVSNVVEMLYLSGKSDTAAYVADRPLEHDPGTTYFYVVRSKNGTVDGALSNEVSAASPGFTRTSTSRSSRAARTRAPPRGIA